MSKCIYKVKTWDELVEEFGPVQGSSDRGVLSINDYTFTSGVRRFSGRVFEHDYTFEPRCWFEAFIITKEMCYNLGPVKEQPTNSELVQSYKEGLKSYEREAAVLVKIGLSLSGLTPAVKMRVLMHYMDIATKEAAAAIKEIVKNS